MADAHKYQAHEVLNRVLNAGEDGLNVDLADSVTVTVDSEFPAAAAITDDFANPTTTSAMSMLMGYDGSAWDRVVIGAGTEAAALRVTIATNSTGVLSIDDNSGSLTVDNGGTFAVQSTLQAGSASIGTLGANSGTDIGDVDVTSLPASTNTLEVVGDAAENAAAAGNPVLTGGRYDSPGDDNSTVRTLGDNDVGALALDPTGALYVREYLGQSGNILVTGTSAVTAAIGKFVAIQFLEDTVFASGSGGLVATDEGRWLDDDNASTDISSSNGANTDSETFPQGITIFGRWDSFTLASGKVVAYIGMV